MLRGAPFLLSRGARPPLRHPSAADSQPIHHARMTVRRYASAAEADRHDLEFWRQRPDAERIREVWRPSQELWRL